MTLNSPEVVILAGARDEDDAANKDAEGHELPHQLGNQVSAIAAGLEQAQVEEAHQTEHHESNHLQTECTFHQQPFCMGCSLMAANSSSICSHIQLRKHVG